MDESEQTAELTAAEEQQSEEQTFDDTSSDETDNTSEETLEAEKPEVKKPNRAQERIRETISRAKRAEQERDYYKSLAEGRQARTQDDDGVDDTGIDPTKFAQSLERRTLGKAEQLVTTRLEAIQAEQDFPELKSSRIFQNLAKAYVSEGHTPYEAAMLAKEDYDAELKTRVEDKAKRQTADRNLRSATFSPSGTTTHKADSDFTEAQIASMSRDEYEKNLPKILKQYGIRN